MDLGVNEHVQVYIYSMYNFIDFFLFVGLRRKKISAGGWTKLESINESTAKKIKKKKTIPASLLGYSLS